MTAAESERHPKEARRPADEGSVIITEHGRPAFVLLRHDEYEQLRAASRGLPTLPGAPGHVVTDELGARHRDEG